VPELTKDVHGGPWEEGDADNKTVEDLDDAAVLAEEGDWPSHCFDNAKSVSEGEACRSPGPWKSTARSSALEPDDPWVGE
jgi:hypothetical protein